MFKIAGFALLLTLTAVSAVLWAKSPDASQAAPIHKVMPGISPLDLHREIDTQRLPVLEVDDLI